MCYNKFVPNSDALALLLIAAFLFGVATNIQAGWLFPVVSFLLSFVLVSFLYPSMLLGGIRIRKGNISLFEGEEVLVDLRVRNCTRRPKHFLEVREDQADATGRIFLPFLPPGGEAVLQSRFAARKRGIFSFLPVRVTSKAPAGLFLWGKRVAVEGRIVVYPLPVPILAGSSLFSLSQEASPGFAISGEEEFFALRPYHQGESRRKIHWPTSARVGTLMVREEKKGGGGKALILIDLQKDHLAGGESHTTLDYSARLAAFLARELTRNGQEVCVVAGSLRFQSRNWWEILEGLAALLPSRESFQQTIDRCGPRGEPIASSSQAEQPSHRQGSPLAACPAAVPGAQREGLEKWDHLILLFPFWKANLSLSFSSLPPSKMTVIPLLVSFFGIPFPDERQALEELMARQGGECQIVPYQRGPLDD